MSAPIVSATMGVMNPLLGKLTALLGDEYKKFTSVRKQASFLKDELSTMKAFLEKLELMDKLDPMAKNWRDHVREMSYDMENCIDDLMCNLGDADAKSGFITKTGQCLKKLRQRHSIADRMEELKVLALEANERRMRYKIDDCVSYCGVAPVDPRMSAIYKDAAGLVGIDGPREELIRWLRNTEKKLKVVSIVGFGGLGKTTLAKQVYDEMGGQFSCKAFLSVSQRPDMTNFLDRLQVNLGMKEESSHAREAQGIVDRLREHLTYKRYLIVVDDLWDQSAWNIISCAFPENGTGSRVMITTRVDDVAVWACRNDRECIYRMKPLEEQDSRMLFFNRVFGSEDCCPPQFEEVSAVILKKCGGLPLAIITIASLLASRQARSSSEWESISNSLGDKLATQPTLQEMRSILNLSYLHLPLHLRACFLYLGMYPEDQSICREILIRQWIAEGFVSNLHGSYMEDVARSYFNELINRSLIQPQGTYYGEVMFCRVHDMLLDLILSKCAEENFITVAYNCGDMERMHGYEHKARRLSLSPSTDGPTSGATDTSLSQVRSFAWFGKSTYTPPLSQFKYLRMLAFEVPSNRDITLDLTAIGQLFHLRCLNVSAESGIIKLPSKIQGLVHLQTLQIQGRLAQSFPSDIVLLPRLSCLVLPYCIGLPQGIRNMKSLCTIHCLDTGKSSLEDIKDLTELPKLRELRLAMDYECNLTLARANTFLSSIGKLYKLKCLTLSRKPLKPDDDQLYSLSNINLYMEKLNLLGWPIKRVPKWILDLHCLHNLSLCVEHLSTEEVLIIGKLPSLVLLFLWVLRIPEDGATILWKGLFPVLEVLRVLSGDDDITACIEFEAGVMPNLRQLTLIFCDRWGGTIPIGMEHLLRLEHISLSVGSCVHKYLDIESAFKSAANVHPRRPSVTINYK